MRLRLCFLLLLGGTSTKDNIIKYIVIGMTTIVTFAAMWYIYHLMDKVKPQVIYERRKARYAIWMDCPPDFTSSV